MELEFGGYIFEGEVQLAGYDESYKYGPYMYLAPGYSYHNQINRRITILKFRGLRPDQGHHKKAVSRVSTINEEKNTRKSQLVGKLLDAPIEDHSNSPHKLDNRMVEMVTLGTSEIRKSRNIPKKESKGPEPHQLPPPPPAIQESATYVPPPVPPTISAQPPFGYPSMASMTSSQTQPPQFPSQPTNQYTPPIVPVPTPAFQQPPPAIVPPPIQPQTIQHSSSIIRPGPVMPQEHETVSQPVVVAPVAPVAVPQQP